MIPKVIINGVLKLAVKHFKLDKLEKVYEYVFGENELDVKVENLNDRMRIVESIAHTPREFILCEECKCKIKEK